MKRSWNEWVAQLKKDTYALYLASRDPRVPLVAKVIVILVVAYVLSPIDLIPDFIPVLGYLDDMVLVPLGMAAAIRAYHRTSGRTAGIKQGIVWRQPSLASKQC